MSQDVTAEAGLTFELLLEAVQESRRGRWFLEEFKTRSCGESTQKILSAIAKLEDRLSQVSVRHSPATEMDKVRGAIAATRDEIVKSLGSPTLSREARLFAHLADVARKSATRLAEVTGNAQLPQGIVRALHLVDQIDSDLNRTVPEGDTYFKRDSELFETDAASSKPVLVAAETATANDFSKAPDLGDAAAKPSAGPVSMGARLVISRTSAPANRQDAASVASSQVQPVPAAATAADSPSSSADGHPRIVIVRRKPGDMPPPVSEVQSLAEHAA
jgi:hypothetical protein